MSQYKKTIYSIAEKVMTAINSASFIHKRDKGEIAVFNTELGSDNLGDAIIMRYCLRSIEQIFPESRWVNFSTHRIPSNNDINELKRIKYRFLCGTNLLTSEIEKHWNWSLPDGFIKKYPFRNVILFGAGWHSYQDECTEYTKLIYHELLNPKVLHSVRDSYSELKLKNAGIHNVLNTGCPTMWALSPEFCSTIPEHKSKNVVTTITDYRRDPVSDNELLKTLGNSYDQVYLWLQGRNDEAYLRELSLPDNLFIIPRSLKEYESILKSGHVDYIGTRLHAGIFALNHRVRSLIVSVDNRAEEISKDTNLSILPRERIDQLEQLIFAKRETSIKIQRDNIDRYLEQFRR